MIANILSTIVTAVTTLISGLAQALTSGFESVFITGTGSDATISNTGLWIVALLGLSLAFGVFRWVLGLVRAKR